MTTSPVTKPLSPTTRRSLSAPPRGEVWWLTPLNKSCRQAERREFELSLSALAPPELSWRLALPLPRWITDLRAPPGLRLALRDLRVRLRRGELARAFAHPLQQLRGDRATHQVWRRWPLSQPLSAESVATPHQAETQRAISATDFIDRSHRAAITQGTAQVSRVLWKLLEERLVPIPLEWSRSALISGYNPEAPQAIESLRELALSVGPLSSEDQSELRWLLADLLIASGVRDATVIPPLISLDPTSPRALKWLIARPQWSPLIRPLAGSKLSKIELDPERIIQAHKRQPWSPLRRGRLGQLLDHQALYLRASGEGIRWVTEVIRVNNREGVEELGELRLPDESRLISLYHRKALGGYRAPLRILTTGGYSLSDLQVGDYLVASYLEPVESGRMSGGALTPRIPLADVDRAVGRRVIQVFAQDHEAFTGHVAPDQAPPSPALLHVSSPQPSDVDATRYQVERHRVDQAESRGEVIQVIVEQAQPIKREPASPPAHLLTPALRIGEALRPLDERSSIATKIHQMVSRDLGLCERARVALKTSEETSDVDASPSVAQLLSYVGAQLQKEVALLDSPHPAEALTRGVGHRGLTLSALMSDCGYQHELWLARARDHIHQPIFDQLDDFDHLLIHWSGRWIDPDLSEAPLGTLSGAIAGGAVTPIWPLQLLKPLPASPQVPSLTTKTLPWSGATGPVVAFQHQETFSDHVNPSPLNTPLAWTHSVRGALHLDRERPLGVLSARAFTGAITHTFSGADGWYLYHRMSRASPEGLRGWIERQWSGWWGPSEVSDAQLTYQRGVATLRYQLLVWARPRRNLSPTPQSWGKRFGSLKTRAHPLMLPIVAQRVELEISGLALAEGERDETITLPTLTQQSQRETSSSPPLLWVTSSRSPHPSEVTARFTSSVRQVNHDENLNPQEPPQPHDEEGRARSTPSMKLIATWRLSGGLLDTGSYREWREFARSVDEWEVLRVHEEPPQSNHHEALIPRSSH